MGRCANDGGDDDETLLLHRAFRRITSIINQQLHLHKFHIETLRFNIRSKTNVAFEGYTAMPWPDYI